MDVRETSTPKSSVEPVVPTLDRQKRDEIGSALYQAINNDRGDRSTLKKNLDYYTSLYEMQVGERNYPWPKASNIFVPIVPTMVDAVVAQLSSVVFVPRLFLVTGNTPQAADVQHVVERYYNAELARYNRLEQLYQWLHLSVRDGTAVLEILWKQRKRKRKVVQTVDVTDPDTGETFPNPNGEGNLQKTEVVELDITEFDDVEYTPVALEDFMVFPAWQTSIEDAAGVGRAVLLSENDLNAMVAGGVLWRDAVDKALTFLASGQSELTTSPDGNETYQAGGQISIGSELAGVDVGDTKVMRGPLRVWRIHTNMFDLDGDGSPEENVFWYDELSQTLLGFDAYKYWHGQRPFVDYTPMPRPNRFYGYGVPERLRTVQEETNAIHNQKMDQIELRTSPPFYQKSTAKVDDENRKWGPGARYVVEGPEDVGVFQLPPLAVESWQEEAALKQMGQELIGLSNPMVGAMNSGRRTAKEVQTAAASAGVRMNLMAARLRQALKRVFFQHHHLVLQYGPDNVETTMQKAGQPEKLQVPKTVLAQDFDMTIAGIGNPLDSSTRRQDTLFLYSLAMKNPLVANNLMRVWRVTQMLFEEFDRPDIQALIGTAEEAQQQMQAQQQAAQQQQQQAMMAQAMGHQPPQQAKPQPQQQSNGPKLA